MDAPTFFPNTYSRVFSSFFLSLYVAYSTVRDTCVSLKNILVIRSLYIDHRKLPGGKFQQEFYDHTNMNVNYNFHVRFERLDKKSTHVRTRHTCFARDSNACDAVSNTSAQVHEIKWTNERKKKTFCLFILQFEQSSASFFVGCDFFMGFKDLQTKSLAL